MPRLIAARIGLIVVQYDVGIDVFGWVQCTVGRIGNTDEGCLSRLWSDVVHNY